MSDTRDMTAALFWLGFVLWVLGAAGILVAVRFSTVGRSRTSIEVMRVTFPISSVGALLIIPYVLEFGMGSAFQDVMMVFLLVTWAVCGGMVAYACTSVFPAGIDDADSRPFFGRASRSEDPVSGDDAGK